MIALTNGKTLTAGDLAILVRDAQGNLLDPQNITYSIFQISQALPVKPTQAYEYDTLQPQNMKGGPPLPPEGLTLVGMPNVIPCRASQGAYFANITVPPTWQGIFRLTWYLQQYPASPVDQVYEDFAVQAVDPLDPAFEAPSMLVGQARSIASGGQQPPPYSPMLLYAKAVKYVRILLRDNNPDRNYHFRPPTPGKVVAGYTTRVGFIWMDEDILMNLDMAISKLNTWNPMNYTGWTLDTIPADWGRAAALGAAALCLLGESARWTADEFSYSLNGVSLDINKSGMYQTLGTTYDTQFTTWAPLLTANRPFSAGLRQQRWLLG
jgi:hypothetical protein